MAEHRVAQFMEKPQPQDQPVLRTVWVVFVGTVCIYALVGYVIRQQGGRPPSSEMLSLLVLISGGVAAVSTALIFSWDRIFVKGTDYRAYCIIRWALAESVAICGLVLYLLGASETMAGAFLGWALLSLLRLRPTPEDYLRFQRLKEQQRT